MRKSIIAFITVILCLFTFNVKAEHIDETYDWDKDEHYQNIATDFRTYTVCEAIHDNIALTVSIHYGVSQNLRFGESYLQRIRELLENTLNMKKHFANETKKPIQFLMEEYHVPESGLRAQATRNQIGQKQGLSLAFIRSGKNPNQMSIVIKQLLGKSQTCRNYESEIDYSSLD